MGRTTVGFGLLVMALWPAGARANPVATEVQPGIELAESGTSVVFEFLGMDFGGEGPDYDSLIVVQRRSGTDWVTESGGWTHTDEVRSADGGSGVETYDVYRREAACPGTGSVEYRLAMNWGSGEEPYEWLTETVACTVQSPPPDAAERGCAVGGGPGRWLPLLALLGGLVAWRRRRG